MIRVLVYHRDAERLQTICRMVNAYFQKVRVAYRLTGYRHHEDAVKYLIGSGGKDDILFLDCSVLTEVVDLVTKLRHSNERASWVYMDGELDELLHTLLLRPSAYLKESSDSGEVLSVLQRLVKYHLAIEKKYTFTFKCEGEYIRISHAQISYFESSAKKVTLHLDKQPRTYDFSAKLDDIEAQLPSYFLRCHQSYLVNMQQIRKLDTQNHVFLLGNNEEILISRRNYTHAKERYQQFLLEQ